jgi:hypothetical protein
MSGRTTSISDALDQFVPPFDPDPGDWDEIVRRAAGPAPSPESYRPAATRSRRWTRRRYLLAAAVTAVAATLIATPAFGVRSLILDLFDRTNLPFTGQRAPFVVRHQFYDLSLMPHAALGIGFGVGSTVKVRPGETREVRTFTVDGRSTVLYVAPTTNGGYCWSFTLFAGGCARTGAPPLPGNSGELDPSALNYSIQLKQGPPCPCAGIPLHSSRKPKLPIGQRTVTLHFTNYQKVPTALIGSILNPNAESLLIQYADGTSQRVPFVYVGKPINAGFFVAPVPSGHETPSTSIKALVLLNAAGKVIARRLVDSHLLHLVGKGSELITPPETALPTGHQLPQAASPSRPITSTRKDGVTVDIGSNGVVVFHLAGISSATRALIGSKAGYGCFKFIPYHETMPYELTPGKTTTATVTIPDTGVKPPFDGCEIKGSYGHLWPDHNHSHAAVEIALTPRGQRFFQNRAAALDLALFLNSKTMQAITKTNGATATEIAKRYGTAITRLPTPTSTLPADKIGYTTQNTETTYIEYSTTGQRFYVQYTHGRITRTNIDTLARVK